MAILINPKPSKHLIIYRHYITLCNIHIQVTNQINISETINDHKTKVPIGTLRIIAILPREFKEAITCTIRYLLITITNILKY